MLPFHVTNGVFVFSAAMIFILPQVLTFAAKTVSTEAVRTRCATFRFLKTIETRTSIKLYNVTAQIYIYLCFKTTRFTNEKRLDSP